MSDESASPENEKVGYGKPPKHTQFKKGQSGNPRGRKKRSRNTSTLLLEELETIIEVREGGRTRKMTKREAVIKSLVNHALAGKRDARQLLIKILEVDNPPEAFEATDSDQEMLKQFLEDNEGRADEPGEQP